MASATALAGFAVVGAQQALATEVPSPSAIGSWSAPFVDGASAAPASAVAVLPDGRVLYGDGTAGGSRLLTISGTGVTFAPADGGGLDGDVVALADGRQLVVGGGGSFAPAAATPTAEGPLPAPEGLPAPAGPLPAPEGLPAPAGPLPAPEGLPAPAGPLPAPEGLPAPDAFAAPEAPAFDRGPGEARIFDPFGGPDGFGSWESAGSTVSGRSHATAVTTGDGRVAVLGGASSPVGGGPVTLPVRSTDVFDPATGQWSEAVAGLPGGKSLPPNARIFLAPDGSLFYTGDGQMFAPFGQSPDEALWVRQGSLDLAEGVWREEGITVARSSPASIALPMKAPYDELTILRAGGTLLTSPGSYSAVPTTDLTTVDSSGKVSNRAGPELGNARWFSQATALPTGEVLITSGARNDEAITPGAGLPVRQAELYDPDANTFFGLASTDRARTYRNSAVLLPNGQVLVGGHAPDGLGLPVGDALPGVAADTVADPSFELFNPPYLFRGARPYIDGVQGGFAWGENVTMITQDAPVVTKILLMRMPSPQHVMDNDSRTLELSFAQTSATTLAFDVPADPNVAPPGYYYLFVNQDAADGSGFPTPSVARIVRVGAESDRAAALEPMGEDTLALPADLPAEQADAEDTGTEPAVDPAAPPVDPAAAPVDPAAPLDPAAAPVDPADAPAPAAPGELPLGVVPAPPAGGSGRRAARRG